LKESNNGIQKRRTGEKENNSMKNCCIWWSSLKSETDDI
jgi:hypothetical protein